MLDFEKARLAKRAEVMSQNNPMKVISVTSGKGGVGKSSVAANLGLALASRGDRVLLIDGDFGLANLDIMLDLKPSGTIYHVLNEGRDPRDIVVQVAPNIDILPASSGLLTSTDLQIDQKAHLLEAFRVFENEYDIMLIDTGAGIGDDVTWLNSAAQEVIVVATPEPTSVADAYALIKVLNQKHKRKEFRLLVNQVKSEAEALRVYQQITGVADRFLHVSIDYFGHVLWDDLWTHAIRQRKPMVSAFPTSNAAKKFFTLADTIDRDVARKMASATGFKVLLGHA